MKDMRVLIYGAGVIGSLYAALFSEAGIDVAVYARGERLHSLQTKGLLYRKNGQILSANVTVISGKNVHFSDSSGCFSGGNPWFYLSK